MNPERKKSSKPVWMIGGIVVLGLIVLAAGPLLGATNSKTESIFGAPPDTAELERLGSFDEVAIEPAVIGQATSDRVDRIVASLDGETSGSTATAGASAAGAPAGASVAAATETATATAIATATGSVAETADEAAGEETALGSNVATFSSGDIFGLLWRLALVALIIWASIFVLRKFVMRSSRTSSASGALKVLETIGLSNNRLVYLLEAGDRILVVGSTPNQMTLLAELDDPEVVSALRNDADQTSPKVATLGDMMRDFGQSMGHRFSEARKGRATASGGAAEGFGAAGVDLTPMLQQLLKAQAEIELSARRIPDTRQAGSGSAQAEAEAE